MNIASKLCFQVTNYRTAVVQVLRKPLKGQIFYGHTLLTLLLIPSSTTAVRKFSLGENYFFRFAFSMVWSKSDENSDHLDGTSDMNSTNQIWEFQWDKLPCFWTNMKKYRLRRSRKFIFSPEVESKNRKWALYFRYLTGECNYGGRDTDDKDRRCLMSILGTFYNLDVINNNDFKYSPSGDYFAPDGNYEDYVEYIKAGIYEHSV